MKNNLKTIKYGFIALAYSLCYGVQAQNQLYPDNFDLTTLNGSNGFTINGLPSSAQLGVEIELIGDINNDGLEDMAFGLELASISGIEHSGAAYVIFGSTTPFPTPFDLSTLDGTNGFAIEGLAEQERRGKSIAGPGDINGDGIDDLIFGSSSTTIGLYGSNTFPALITVNDINGTNGFFIQTQGCNEIAWLGDINGDTYNDFIIGRPTTGSGQAWIIFGRSTNFPTSIDVSWLDGTGGFRTSSFSGTIPAFLVGGAGDINNDGINDVLIGNWDSTDPAISYLLFGKNTAFSALVDLTILDGTDGFSIDNNGGGFLSFVGPLGDINNDGIDDFFSETNAIYGSTTPFAAHFPQSNLNGTDGFELPGSLMSAPIGDVNNDGIDDFISTYGSGGKAYIVFGSTTGFPNPINETTLNGLNGFIIDNLNTSNSGNPASGNGDINGDGISDFIIGSPTTSGAQTGEVHVIFGGDHYAMPLNIGYPQAINVTSTALDLLVNGQETGTIHYVIYPGTNFSSPDYDVILSGIGSDANGNFLLDTANTDITEAISALPTNSSFDIYLFFEDDAGNYGEIYSLNNTTLGTNDYLKSNTVIFPNPTMSDVIITLPVAQATYTLTSINGQTLQQGNLEQGNNRVDLSQFSNGLYFLSIKTDVGIVTKKIMKK